jgi:hypothetical protein
MRTLVLAIAAVAATAGCTAGQDTAAAEAAVANFHQLLDAQQFHEIYQASASEFRNATSEPELNRVLQMVHDRLGAVRQAQRSGWHVNYANGTTRVELNYNTQFASAPGTEQFIYSIHNGAATLVSYDVHSDALRSAGAAATPQEGQGAAQTDTGGK